MAFTQAAWQRVLARCSVLLQLGFIMHSPTSSAPKRRSRFEKMVWLGIALLLLVFTVVVPVISVSRAKHRARQLREEIRREISPTERNMLQLGAALQQFQLENGTDTAPYPSDIRQLESMGFITDIEALLEIRSSEKVIGDWLYFWAADSENGSAPLLISPMIGTSYLVLRVNGNVDVVHQSRLEHVIQSSPVPTDKVPSQGSGAMPGGVP